jgi:hypothetical protein
MSHAREFRLINAASAEQRAQWWDGSQARSTVPTFLKEERENLRPNECRSAPRRAAPRRFAAQRNAMFSKESI